MARYTEFEPLYAIYEKFKTGCLLNDNSFFLPDMTIWTSESVSALRQKLVDNPDTSANDFESKLSLQMRDATPSEWVILAEAHLVYYLPPRDHTRNLRRDTVLGYLRKSGLPLVQQPTDEFWDSLSGFSSLGIRYNKRYSQLWLILMFAEAVKKIPNRSSVLDHPEEMKAILDGQLDTIPVKADRAGDMRQALLYLAFPERFQPILSASHREKILNYYRRRFDVKVEDPDRALQQIQEGIAREMSVTPAEVHFYHDHIRAEWDGKTSAPPIANDLSSPTKQISLLDPISTLAPEVTQGLKKLGHTKNLIFTGAPGTGKTYTAQRVAQALVKSHIEESLAEPQIPLSVIEDMKLNEALALALYLRPNERFTNQQILKLPIMAERARSMNAKAPSSVIGTQLGGRTAPGNKYSNIANTRKPYIFDKDEKGWFLSDVGREYVKQELSDYLAMLDRPANVRSRYEDYTQTIAFHPSYAYEDFVEGMRPKIDDLGNLSYEIRPGVLRVMCSRAAADPKRRYVLIIDEINRANLSKVFGELIALIEDDKRLGAPNELMVKLPYSGDTFGVPNNLYFIGTLNTADRSIALMDMALRRRFAFVEVPPRPELLGEVYNPFGNAINLSAVLSVLNSRIRRALGRSHEIGHSYFISVSQLAPDNQFDAFEHVWNTQILPLLEEYFYSRADAIKEILKEFVLREGKPGARLGFAEGEDLVAALSDMVATTKNEV